MSHCAPETTLKPKRFEFTPKTVITDVFIAQVCSNWEAVPKTWPGGSKASVAKCVVHPWNSTRSVGGRVESTSWTFWNSYIVMYKLYSVSMFAWMLFCASSSKMLLCRHCKGGISLSWWCFVFCQDSAAVNSFLDKTLTSRLATRLLCEHHILLHSQLVKYFSFSFLFNCLLLQSVYSTTCWLTDNS